MKLRTALFFAMSFAAMSPVYAAYVKDAMEDRAEARYDAEKDSGKEPAQATDDQMKAYYQAAKEKCDQLSGNAKDTCINDAKLKYRQ